MSACKFLWEAYDDGLGDHIEAHVHDLQVALDAAQEAVDRIGEVLVLARAKVTHE